MTADFQRLFTCLETFRRRNTMALPNATEARGYYRAAFQRLDDSQMLFEANRTTGAVYLAGYTVECLLKALVMNSAPPVQRPALLAELRRIGHDIERLREAYRQRVQSPIPRDIVRHLSRVSTWSSEVRYLPGVIHRQEAEEFLKSTIEVVRWADGRM